MPNNRLVTIPGNTGVGVQNGVLTLVPGLDIANFPVRFAGVYAYLATVPNGGKVQSNTGKDIYFTSDSAGQNRLAFELVAYNPVTGAIEAFVDVATLFGKLGTNAPTLLYLWYGQNNTIDLSNRTGTWNSQYAAVYHFGDGTTLDLTDSTSNHNDGTNVNGVTAGVSLCRDNTNNFVGGSATFVNASAQNINCGNGASIQITGNPGLIMLAIVKATSTSGAVTERGIVGNKTTHYFGAGYQISEGLSSAPVGQALFTDGSAARFIYFSNNLGLGNIEGLFVVFNANDANINLQGISFNLGNGATSSGTSASQIGDITAGSNLIIGGGNNAGTWDWFDGLIDEVRILNTPAGYPFNVTVNGIPRVIVEINNLFQNSNFPFYTLGAETALPALGLICQNLIPGTKGFKYSVFLNAVGGIPPYTFAVTAGALPPGLIMDPINPGFIDGFPTKTGIFTFDVTVTDTQGATAVCHAMLIQINSIPKFFDLVLNPRKLPFTFRIGRHTEGRHYFRLRG